MTHAEYRRRQLGLRQRDVAKIAGITNHSISLIEQERFIPTRDQLERLGRALGLPPDVLLKPIQVQIFSEDVESEPVAIGGRS